MIDDKYIPKGEFPPVLPRTMLTTLAAAYHAASSLSSTSEGMAVEITFPACTIDYVEVYCGAGTGADDFRCRLCDVDSELLPDTSNLIHANADVTLAKDGSAEWKRFDFTNFAVSEGTTAYFVFTADSASAYEVKMAYSADSAVSNANLFGGGSSIRYYDGSDWDQEYTVGGLFIRIKTTDGFVARPSIVAAVSTSSETLLAATNPLYRGNEYVVPDDGIISGVRWYGMNHIGAKVEVKLATADRTVAATGVITTAASQFTHYHSVIHFDAPVAVSAGDVIRVYIKRISGTAVYLYPMDISDGIEQCFGAETGSVAKITAHTPDEEGGSQAWTKDSDAFYPIALIYGEYTGSAASGGGAFTYST